MFWTNSHEMNGTEVTGGDIIKGETKPKIGLALGSGVARGWAHIGVMRRLLAANIIPDVITGSSIGAIVGGCYLANKLDELEEFACSLTKRKVFGLLDFAWRGTGLISGDKLSSLLEEQLGNIQIEDCHTPFACVATELLTGHEIWLKQGRLLDAIRASYALPGVFKPIYFHDKWLIDGAVVNPIPVSVCRAMGSRLVIAVNLNNDFFGTGTVIQEPVISAKEQKLKEENKHKTILSQMFGSSSDAPGITTVLVAAFNISQDRLARSRMAGDPPDIVIAPRFDDVGLFDFQKAKESIQFGWDATERILPDIEHAIRSLGIASDN